MDFNTQRFVCRTDNFKIRLWATHLDVCALYTDFLVVVIKFPLPYALENA